MITIDNPESDIAGANAAGWSSILVHTGVYSPSDGPPSHKPTFQASDVEEAVNAVLTKEAIPSRERKFSQTDPA
jgi:ribonucleotide monophosphatase NagD (HAD superfamily)